MKVVIGKSDKLDFPDLGLKNVGVKIDTGAFTGVIHCSHIDINKRKKVVRFTLLDPCYADYSGEVKEFNYLRLSKVKSSNGSVEVRPIISTKVIIFQKEYLTELSLSGRQDMKFPVLLGRKLLNRNFLVDTSRTNLSYRKKTRNENSRPF